jgi:lipopolysaccharide export system ATP-binding protein
MSYLSVTGLVKRYRNRAVVNEINLQVAEGEIVGLLGPNGAGKTTCFYMLVGLIPVDSGTIYLDGKNITDEAMHIRARHGLSYLAQEPSVFRKLTVEQNVMAALEMRDDLNRDQQKTACEELLRELGIHRLKNDKAISLSGGERRRLEIARALVTNPKMMLLDEPFAGVDPISVKDIQGIISRLSARGISVLITDHNVRETLDICDRAYIVSEGRILAEGSAEALTMNKEVREVYLGHDFSL